MSESRKVLPEKQARHQTPPLTVPEQQAYELVRSRGSMGIFSSDVKKEMHNLAGNMVDKVLKSLQAKGLIKDVVNIRNKNRKCYMAVDFEPSKEISGGTWYDRGTLDTGLIHGIKTACSAYIKNKTVATATEVCTYLNASNAFQMEITLQHTAEIIRALILDKKIEEVKSTGMGSFASVPAGKVCYRISSTGGEATKGGIFSSIPCGVCPRISECTPDGIISPSTCIYYNKWLGLDF